MISFNEKFNKESFLNFLEEFLPQDFIIKEKDVLEITGCQKITNVKELGFCESLDLTVLEMKHECNNDPRVTVATDAFKILKNYDIQKALVAFYNKDSNNWRFSYLTVNIDINDKNKIEKTISNPRRYSFYLGEKAKVKTPIRQLVEKGQVINLEDLLSRFSVEVVNREFYFEIVKHFDSLVSDDTNNLLLPSQNSLNAKKIFTVRLIGRIMFCWFLKHKKSNSGQLIPNDLLSYNSVQEDYYHEVLERLFFEVLNTSLDDRGIRSKYFDLVPYLNGGLFNPQKDDYYELDKDTYSSRFINTLKIKDEWFKSFFELLETYNFTIDENTIFDQELSVDPEMLGRIFENLLEEINPETGITDRKRTGSYYTPREIVEYMVDESLVAYFEEKTGLNTLKLRALVSYDLLDDTENPLSSSEKLKIVDAADSLKIIDPACGSGAFPIGILQKVVYVLQVVDPDGSLWRDLKLKEVPELYRQKIEEQFSTRTLDYIRKLEVIKNCIFGVDIQPIAVEVSRLRCFLTLIVESEIDDSLKNRGIEALPNLDFKFVCANALIPAPEDTDTAGNRLFADDFQLNLAKAVDRYFASTGENKRSANNEIHKLIDGKVEEKMRHLNELVSYNGDKKIELIRANLNKDKINEHSHILTTWDSYKNIFENKTVNFFDTKYFFPSVKNGFDIVIANPPYIDSETMVLNYPGLREILKDHYSSTKGNWDLYIPFIELALKLTNEKGISAYITPNKWYAIKYGEALRKLVVGNFIKIGNCNDVKVFEAGNSPVVSIFGKKPLDKVRVDRFNSKFQIDESAYILTEHLKENLGLALSSHISLVNKIKEQKEKIKTYFLAQNPCTVSEAYEIIELLEDSDEDNIDSAEMFKFVNTGTVDPFINLWGLKDTTYLKKKYKHPVIKRDSLRHNFPNRHKQSSTPKLIVSGMRHFESFLDLNGDYIAGKSTEIIIKNSNFDLHLALGLLNSDLIKFYINESYSVLGIDGGISFTTELINNLPVPDLSEKANECLKIIDLSIEITKRNLSKEDLLKCELFKKLNSIIFDIYNITEEEREIIKIT